jgi:cytochrome d ubiquinol oxidase subunit II
VTLGALLQGIRVEGRAYAGGWWDWLTPFSLLTGVSLEIGYALLGACWLIWKTTGPLQADVRRLAHLLAPLLLVAIGAVSLYNLILLAQYAERWLVRPACSSRCRCRWWSPSPDGRCGEASAATRIGRPSCSP